MAIQLGDLLKESRVVPSAASLDNLKYAVEMTDFPCIMLKLGDINTIGKLVAYIHKHNKTVMLHIDSVRGISKDKAGMHYLKRIGVDAVITMKSQHIRMIKEEEMIAIMGAFLVDSASVQMTIQNVYSNKPDVVVAMPMTIPDLIYDKLKNNINVPIMAGGLGMEKETIDHILSLGIRACAVTDRTILEQYCRKKREE